MDIQRWIKHPYAFADTTQDNIDTKKWQVRDIYNLSMAALRCLEGIYELLGLKEISQSNFAVRMHHC